MATTSSSIGTSRASSRRPFAAAESPLRAPLVTALGLVSYKIRFHDRHVRAVVDGHAGPGVDLRGADAERVIAAAHPMVRWLEEREPGVDIRSVSVNDTRVLVSLAGVPTTDFPNPKPRALRIEMPDLREAGREAEALIHELASAVIARRA